LPSVLAFWRRHPKKQLQTIDKVVLGSQSVPARERGEKRPARCLIVTPLSVTIRPPFEPRANSFDRSGAHSNDRALKNHPQAPGSYLPVGATEGYLDRHYGQRSDRVSRSGQDRPSPRGRHPAAVTRRGRMAANIDQPCSSGSRLVRPQERARYGWSLR
jgi:hypothetical protein